MGGELTFSNSHRTELRISECQYCQFKKQKLRPNAASTIEPKQETFPKSKTMKNLYKKGKVHPSTPSVSHHLSLLPTTILTLAAALSDEDKQVLAYLISCCGTSNPKSTSFTGQRKTTLPTGDDHYGDDGGGNHDPVFECNCFSCYMSFWALWDTSPNRQLIHEIIEAYEEELFQKKKKSLKKKKKEKSKRVRHESKENFEEKALQEELESVEKNSSGEIEAVQPEAEKGTVRKIASFIGEKFWEIWSRG